MGFLLSVVLSLYIPLENRKISFIASGQTSKQIASIKENAHDLIEGMLPVEVLATLDLSSLALDKDSFIDETLSEYFSDLVYTCQCSNKKSLKICLLLEHKSYKPQYEHLQLLTYMLNIWRHEENNNLPLSIIIPVIFYHGETAWEYRPVLSV